MTVNSLDDIIAVCPDSEGLKPKAVDLADGLGLSILPPDSLLERKSQFDLILEVKDSGLQIQPCGKGAPGPILGATAALPYAIEKQANGRFYQADKR